MAHYGGVTVRVITNDKLCPMYDDPDADGHEDPFSESSPPQKYIEAVTGAKFAVVVTLDPHFQYGDCDAVRAKVYFDGTSRNHGTKLHLKSKDANGGSLKKRTMRFSSLTSYCPQTAQFQKGNLTFGELKMNETSDSTHSLSEVKDLGQIRVVWKRAYLGEETVRPPRTDRIRKIPEVSEKLLKGKAIENVVE
ncbi:MAG: hypothetical protein Q9199_002647 [Rusavskia elegans]